MRNKQIKPVLFASKQINIRFEPNIAAHPTRDHTCPPPPGFKRSFPRRGFYLCRGIILYMEYPSLTGESSWTGNISPFPQGEGISLFSPRGFILNRGEYPSFRPRDSSLTGNISLFSQGIHLEQGISLFSPRGIILNREYPSFSPGKSSWTGNIPLFPQGNHLEQGISFFFPRETILSREYPEKVMLGFFGIKNYRTVDYLPNLTIEFCFPYHVDCRMYTVQVRTHLPSH